MIDCRQLLDFCYDFVDGALPLDEQTRFRKHIEGCQECEIFFETYRKTPEISREALATRMPDSVRESLRTFLARNR